MKLSYNWLKEYVDIDISVKEIARVLTMSGSEVDSISKINGDSVMELEITSNRPDCLNIVGLAREVSAVLDKELKLPTLPSFEKQGTKSDKKIECIIRKEELCAFYSARTISNVMIKGSGKYISERITAIGLRTVNNIVDITNYCLMELGQPLHAFDLDKIKGDKIFIREAEKDEKIVTIDGIERVLEPGMLVIADMSGPIAIAGVMGGKNTEVTGTTKNILLESAYFNPLSIRRTARKLGISSDSSYRFERDVDMGMVVPASNRALKMIIEEAGGEPGVIMIAGKMKDNKTIIDFDIKRAEKILGVLLGKEKVKSIFARLGIIIAWESENKLSTIAPEFRKDLRKEVDLIEETARIFGYDRIPSCLPEIVPKIERKKRPRCVDEKIRELLSSNGLQEIMTYSLISEGSSNKVKINDINKAVLKNPLSEEQKVLTNQLIDGMLRSILWNINRKNKDLALFEIGKVYSKNEKNGTYAEIPALCIGMTGALRRNWRERERKTDLYDIKGVVESFLSVLSITVKFAKAEAQGFSDCAKIIGPIQNKEIGFLGKAAANLLKTYGLTEDIYIAHILLGDVIGKAVLENSYKPVSRFPFSSRDVSILCDKGLASSAVIDHIVSMEKQIVKKIDIIDVYEGEQLEKNEKSVTYTISYGLADRTLTDKEIEDTHSEIKESLRKKFKISFR